MEKSPKSLPSTRPEVLPGLALSPLTLAGCKKGRIRSASPDRSSSAEALDDGPLPHRPFIGAAPEESEEPYNATETLATGERAIHFRRVIVHKPLRLWRR